MCVCVCVCVGGELLVEKRKRRVATLKRELDHVEREQERLEERGVVLEQQLRQKEVRVQLLYGGVIVL